MLADLTDPFYSLFDLLLDRPPLALVSIVGIAVALAYVMR
jgi:hypothetical protein